MKKIILHTLICIIAGFTSNAQTITLSTSPSTADPCGTVITPSGSVYNGCIVNGYSWTPSASLSCAACCCPTATPAVTTTYTCTFSSATCGSTFTYITVSPGTPSGGTISGPTSVYVGATINLTETYSSGTWSSSASGVADINPSTGVVTGVSSGSATITYTTSGACGTAYSTYAVTVNPSPVVISGPSSVCVDGTINLTSSPSGGTWSSSASGIADVNATTGVVTGITSGTATITCTVPGSGYGTYTVTVLSAVAPISPSSASVCVDDAVWYSSATTGGTWSTSSSSIAEVDGGGEVTGIASGTTTVTYTAASGCYATATVNVIALPVITIADASMCAGGIAVLTASGASSYTWYPYTTLSSSTGSTVTGTPTSTTTYHVYGTDATTGCTNEGIATITVNPLPTISAGSTVTICNGSSALLTASGGSTYTWSPATGLSSTTGTSVTASPTTTTTYVVTGTDANGCVNTANKTVVVEYPLSAPTITGTGFIAVGTTLNLVGTPSGGTWTSGDPTKASILSTGVVTGECSGSVPITYTVSNSCTTRRTVTTITVNCLRNINAGGNVVCLSSTYTYTHPTYSTGTWTSSNTAIATIEPTTGVLHPVTTGGPVVIRYTVTGTGLCAACSTAYTEKTVYILPYASISGPNTVPIKSTSCGTSTALYTNGAGLGGTCAVWSCSPSSVAIINGSTGTLTAVGCGTATVTFTCNNCSGCGVASTTKNVSIVSASCLTCKATVESTSLDEVSDASEITIYPNPASGFVNVDFAKLHDNTDVVISDLNGKIVMRKALSESDDSKQTFDIHGMAVGMYIIKVTTPEGTITKKLLIE